LLDPELPMRSFASDDLFAISWVGGCDTSADASRVAVVVTRLVRAEDQYGSVIWVVDVATGERSPFTSGGDGDRRLVVRMAEENPTWGYTRIRGAMKNVGHRVGRSTIARILKAHGLPPGPERPTSWQTFLRAHWGAIAGADFFTTEVWTWRGLITYYTVFVIGLATRRVQVVGSTPHPDELFMGQVSRTLTAADEGILVSHRVLICDRDAKWSAPVRARLGEAGIRVVQTPFQAPNANAYTERFVRSIRDECLNRPFGERHLRRTIAEFIAHYHGERNHQGLGNGLIDGAPLVEGGHRIHRRQRLGGLLLNYYARAASWAEARLGAQPRDGTLRACARVLAVLRSRAAPRLESMMPSHGGASIPHPTCSLLDRSILPANGIMLAVPTKKKTSRKVPPMVAAVRPVSTRLSRMEDLLIEMRAEQDVKLKKINRLQQQFDELTETVKRRLI
jgi:putative transposase